MKLTVEISMYPFRDGYLDPIQWFIERLDQYPNIERVTNAMATQISGDYNEVMALLAREMKAAYEKWGKAVFVCKFIGGALDLSHKQ
ncbi:YkoF family thiamine/hydroxymethylpyrimidine-binding protein [Simiduia curdlanivorans]|uniref:YkoF family thiamine/hydroxymethylpyrimidine-binding protein n=1 Tax=Simiduia curdlanivorans TaxID=1492769 RepID=A0ABV8V7T8_9GAMM|nr:YkoF family thiamine/hydroxymethylpyrimidine-binding protein [Simiduia curdlanivorans]MDN3638665.1 YkoF family thiamine/hydroxymethylpyrimidine-binding protein [Simiduia curdlanivorans]